MYTIHSGATIKASGKELVVNGQQKIPFGVFSISADTKNILLTPAFPGVGSFIYVDTGLRRKPAAGDYYFVVGDKAGTIYRAIGSAVFSLPATAYGILHVVNE